MRRFGGSQDIYLYCNQDKEEFDELRRKHWLRSDKLYYLTSQKQYRMRMDATIWSNGNKKNPSYSHFRVDDETNNYRLHVYGYNENTGEMWSHQ